MKKKGFGMIEAAIAFTLFAIIGGISKGLIEYENHPSSTVDSYK
jgi:hypothetical protein